MFLSRVLRGPFSCFAVWLMLSTAEPSHSQSKPPASRDSGIAIFGGVTTNSSGFGTTPNFGSTLGVAYTYYTPFFVSPSFEARTLMTDGPDARETAYLIGPRVQFGVGHRFSPYADFLFGRGYAHLNHPAPTDPLGGHAFVSSWGIGLNTRLYKHFDLKLDYQARFVISGYSDIPHPSVATVGVAYHIPIGGRKAH